MVAIHDIKHIKYLYGNKKNHLFTAYMKKSQIANIYKGEEMKRNMILERNSS